MPNQQMPGDFSYGGSMRAGKRADGQQALMLLRLEPRRPGGLFAEMEKAADLKAEIGERSIVCICQIASSQKRELIRI